MIGPVPSIMNTTQDAIGTPLKFDLYRPGQGLFDATFDGGRPRRACHGREWFLTGFVLALGLVAVLALFVPLPARAAVVATGANEAGGYIYLTDLTSKHCGKGEYVVMSASRGGGRTRFGCWAVLSDMILARWWDDSSISLWNPADLTLRETEASAVPDYQL